MHSEVLAVAAAAAAILLVEMPPSGHGGSGSFESSLRTMNSNQKSALFGVAGVATTTAAAATATATAAAAAAAARFRRATPEWPAGFICLLQ